MSDRTARGRAPAPGGRRPAVELVDEQPAEAPAPAVPPSRDQQREETRQKVYEAALEVFRRDGIAEARIDDIARAAGVSRGTFYFHFPTKDLVLAERLRLAERRIASLLEGSRGGTRLPALLDRVAAAIAEEWESDPKIFAGVIMVAIRIVAADLRMAESNPVQAELVPHFREAIERKQIVDELPAQTLCELFLLHLFAAALAWCGNPSTPLRPLLENTVRLYFYGVARTKR
jgi:AcrR family transcriptional regulator